MLKAFLSEDGKKALTGAVVAVEKRTSAELVIAVRARSARYSFVEFGVGIAVMLAALAFMLFSPYEFSTLSIFIDPILAGVAAGLLATQVDPLHRALVPRTWRQDHARVLAQSIFYERGVRHTSDRIGILLYFSLLERVAVVVLDSGASAALEDNEEWQAAVAALDAVIARGESSARAAESIIALGEVLEPRLPRSEFDINELPDEVDA